MSNQTNKQISKELLSFIKSSPSVFHAIDTITKALDDSGFTRLNEFSAWNLTPGNYYVTRNNSSVIAFKLPEGEYSGFNIAASHSDSPTYKLKENCEISGSDFIRLATERYGGMICSTWLDRPLSVAGRIVYRTESGISTKLVDVNRDLVLIPNVPVHQNRNINDGFSFNAAVDTVPLYSSSKSGGSVIDDVAKAAKVKKEDILGSDLYLYSRVTGSVWGGKNEFVSSRSLDDLQCAFGSLKGFIAAEPCGCVPVFACFDNEEVGSSTKQGAASTFLYDTLLRLSSADNGKFRQLLANSFLLSCDNAHSVHPNHPEYSDHNNKCIINGGIVIKFNANQKYTTDSVSEAVVKLICKKAGVPYQVYANRSDLGGGSTLGNIATTKVSVNSADIGLAQFAMHSSYETAGVEDTLHLINLTKEFFMSPIKATSEGYDL